MSKATEILNIIEELIHGIKWKKISEGQEKVSIGDVSSVWKELEQIVVFTVGEHEVRVKVPNERTAKSLVSDLAPLLRKVKDVEHLLALIMQSMNKDHEVYIAG